MTGQQVMAIHWATKLLLDPRMENRLNHTVRIEIKLVLV